MKKFLVLLLAPVVLAGCSSVSNLTPSKYPRNVASTYIVEAKWNSNRQAVEPETITPIILVGDQTYPMQQVPLVKDRWEGQIPVAPGQTSVQYQFRFDYKVNAMPHPKPESTLSPMYRLDVTEGR